MSGESFGSLAIHVTIIVLLTTSPRKYSSVSPYMLFWSAGTSADGSSSLPAIAIRAINSGSTKSFSAFSISSTSTVTTGSRSSTSSLLATNARAAVTRTLHISSLRAAWRRGITGETFCKPLIILMNASASSDTVSVSSFNASNTTSTISLGSSTFSPTSTIASITLLRTVGSSFCNALRKRSMACMGFRIPSITFWKVFTASNRTFGDGLFKNSKTRITICPCS